jgi:hypothetical protein
MLTASELSAYIGQRGTIKPSPRDKLLTGVVVTVRNAVIQYGRLRLLVATIDDRQVWVSADRFTRLDETDLLW